MFEGILVGQETVLPWNLGGAFGLQTAIPEAWSIECQTETLDVTDEDCAPIGITHKLGTTCRVHVDYICLGGVLEPASRRRALMKQAEKLTVRELLAVINTKVKAR